MTITFALLSVIIAYLLGSVNSAIIISRLVSGKDIRNSGSGNAGATNVLRSVGKGAAIATMLFDVLKGVFAVLIGGALANAVSVPPQYFAMVSGIAVILGHNYPVYFGFKGGKGIATSAAVIMTMDWKIGVALLIIALTIMAISKYVSLGSIVASALFPIAALIVHSGDWTFFMFALAVGVLAIYKHKENIKRLINGTESKLGSKKKTADAEKGIEQ